MRYVLPGLVALAFAAAIVPVRAGEPENLASNVDFAAGLEGWNLNQDDTCQATLVPAQAGGFSRALHLVVKPRPGTSPWSVMMGQLVDSALLQDDRAEIRVWMRSPEGFKVTVYLEVAKDPWTKSLSETFTLTGDWKEYVVSGKCLQAYAPGGANLGFHLGYGAGTIEIAGVRLFDLDARPVAGGARPTVDKPISLIANGDFATEPQPAWSGSGPDRLRVTPIAAEVGGDSKAVRLESTPPADARPWDVQFGQVCAQPVRKGDAVYFRAWLRSPDKSQVAFIYEMSSAPNTKYIDQVITPTAEWKEYRFVGRLPVNWDTHQTQAKFFLGYGKGTVEIAGVRVEDYGKAPDSAFDETIDYWGGREHSDAWRQPALERIERLRKGDLKIRVVDANGQPVPDAMVSVQQTRHYFRFGTAAPAGRFVDTQNPDNLRFQQEVARLFNTVTFENDLKWASTSQQTLATVDRAAAWLKAHDIDLRGHCLLWGSYQHIPDLFKALRGTELLAACKTHVTDYASRMKERLYLWDVVNEAGSNTEVWDNIGWEAFADAYRWARAADPSARLCYNDYSIAAYDAGYRNTVHKRVQYLLDHNAPVDVLGDQAHLGLPLLPITTALACWDEWAKFGKALEITEYDLGCKDDKIHADYMRDFMTAAFSHPSMKSFVMWGFWEGSHWRAHDGGAMFRRDWSPRPAVQVYEDLVFKQWWTNWQGKTDQDGAAALRAFYGRHKVTVTANGKQASATIELAPHGQQSVEVRLP